MANQRRIPLIAALLFLSYSLHSHPILSSSDPPAPSPSPVAQLAADSPSATLSHAPSNPPETAAPVADISSAPPSESPSPLPEKNPDSDSDSPSEPPSTEERHYLPPSPAPVEDGAAEVADEHAQKEGSSDDGGVSSAQKAGIAVGVLVGACAVGVAGFVYKKRQDNIRRSQYGYDARSSMI